MRRSTCGGVELGTAHAYEEVCRACLFCMLVVHNYILIDVHYNCFQHCHIGGVAERSITILITILCYSQRAIIIYTVLTITMSDFAPTKMWMMEFLPLAMACKLFNVCHQSQTECSMNPADGFKAVGTSIKGAKKMT